MLYCIIFFSSFVVATGTQNIQPLQSSTEGSCDRFCTCKEKDNVLIVNCEERNITKITQIQLPLALPFHLNLYKNDLVELKAEELDGFRNAISLNLGSNSIQQIEPGVFSALSSLKRLHINSNFLVTLKEDTFQGLLNLEYLQADTNFIHTIESGAFSKLVHLKVLILNDNAIEFLPTNIFRFVPLTHLDLRGNQLQSLPYMGFLEHLGRIMTFLLEDNNWVCDCEILPLKIWMENMSGQTSISEVICSSPPHLQDSLLSKVKQEVLCPSYSEADLVGPSKLLLKATSSNAEQVPKGMDAKDDAKIPAPDHKPGVAFCSDQCSCHIHPTAGFIIHCQDRGIRRISDIGLLQQSPTKLVLTGNMVQRLFQFDFVAFEGLELLNLANNQIDSIDDNTFLTLGQLKKLYLNGNRLEMISPGMFIGLHSLEYLYLEYNVIKNILSWTFNTMPNLKLLYLNNNLLQTLPSHVFHNVPLARLNLRKNLFMHLPVSSVLDQLLSLEQIYLEDNPWDCSCDLVALKQWVGKLGEDIVVGRVLCQTPSEIANVELRTLRLDVMCSGLMLHSLPTKEGVEGTPATVTTERSTKGFFQFFNAVPLSVLIVSLLIIFFVIIFCAAGAAVFILHRRQRSSKKQANDQPRENSPFHVQYSVQTMHHTAQRPRAYSYSEPAQSTVMQVCRSPTYCARKKVHELDELDELSLDEMKHVCRSLLEPTNDLPPAGPNFKLRAITDCPSDLVSLGDTGSLYQNILKRERDLQQLGITDYLRENIAQLQPPAEIQGQGRLMEAIMYARSRKVLVEHSKNEYFELKAKLRAEPDYLEVIENQTSVT
ncbi:SLIT and NTRK-like protein 6 [Conger conger]|uniref:SLIT and NTRK-like protein 6 n=1 Tax=Conger conger TaxID=82655 RepID=UPI002A5A0190|nr:SLIT and NTRK-like protein 6 [Conger conger]